MKWFKFYGQDWMSDPKIAGMSMEDRLCLITLFCIASGEQKDGVIKSLNEYTLISLAQIPDSPTADCNPAEQARGVLKRLETLRIVTLGDNGAVTLCNYSSRQGNNTSNAERQKKYRERLKTKDKSSNGVTVTRYNDSNARIEENRIEVDESKDSSGYTVEKELASSEGKKTTPEMRAVFALFEDRPARKIWHTRVHQRKAAKVLDETWGIAELKKRYIVIRKHRNDELCPQIDNPSDFLEKMPKMEKFLKSL